MSLYGALLTGVSGLDANSRALSITSSNISNVNTVGYKTSHANFSTFLATSGTMGDISPSSVQVNSSQRLTQQGPDHIDGFVHRYGDLRQRLFIVTDNAANPASMLYTRAGGVHARLARTSERIPPVSTSKVGSCNPTAPCRQTAIHSV
jgi:flagellar hook protein FlgE